MENVLLEHGDGGALSAKLVDFISKTLGEVYLGEMEDSYISDKLNGRLAITTDSFTVDPLFFKNGDIGKIAVCGTVNDIAVSGAIPKYITLAMIIEEGFPITYLNKILNSIKKHALNLR